MKITMPFQAGLLRSLTHSHHFNEETLQALWRSGPPLCVLFLYDGFQILANKVGQQAINLSFLDTVGLALFARYNHRRQANDSPPQNL